MSNFVKDFYSDSGVFPEDYSPSLEQLAYDMALNRYLIGCRERLDRYSFILAHNCELYQVMELDEDLIIVQMVEETSDHKYQLVSNTLRIMDLEEYGEFVQETAY